MELKIQMLEAVLFPERLVGMYLHKPDIDIVIFSINLGVGVVGNIMFQLPQVNVSSQ